MKNKIVLLFVLAVLMAGTYACSPSHSSQIEGQWKCVSLVMSMITDDGTTTPIEFMKASQCENPNTSNYTFDIDTKTVTVEELFSCQKSTYIASYKWLNEENDLEMTIGEANSVTLLHVVSISSDSLVMTTGEADNPVRMKMVKVK